MKPRRRKAKGEPTIALINVVFLMLIFFLIAGTLAPPLDPELTLVNTADLDSAAPPEGLVINADGTLQADGQPIASAQDYYATHSAETVRVVPDQALPAKTLLQIGAALHEAGAETVLIATERSIQ
ncbi:biopolymer transport protein ExbD [Yoonia maritima]|uniref:Biopolymer transport protein ExbD n=1 Tax=Yoonia maritima TaxID=1435347 RepID=A0A2T0VZK9_9RHOB|nr:biopolymer transporter ExbD [Yoonia maritima]PRY77798.1 biopolymer transport protein ExbD [Yoonia maritima]